MKLAHKNTDLARRTFLKGLGLGAGMMPILNLSDAQAAGAAIGTRKRVIIIVQTNGTLADQFFPKGGGSDLTQMTLPAITSPLDEFKKDLIFVDGVAIQNFIDYGPSLDPGAGHENYASQLTGTKGVVIQDGGNRFEGSSPTIDQLIATDLAAKVQLPVKSLHLATQVDDKQGRNFFRRAFWKGPRMGVTPEHDPGKAVATLFGAGGNGNTAALDKVRAERRSMLDFVGKDIERFSAKLGKEDREKVGGHLAAIRDLESQLKSLSDTAGTGAGGCKGPAVPDFNIKDNNKYPQLVDLQMSVIAAAFACDVTRVATLQLTDGSATNLIMSWLGYGPTGNFSSGVGDLNSYHSITHGGGEKKVKSDQWFIQQLANMIKKLKAIPEGAGKTAFDNTVILWTNHMGNGGAHSSDRLPWVLAGSCGGYYKTGQVLRGRTPTNRVLVSLANAMGVPREYYGEQKYGGELPGLKA